MWSSLPRIRANSQDYGTLEMGGCDGVHHIFFYHPSSPPISASINRILSPFVQIDLKKHNRL